MVTHAFPSKQGIDLVNQRQGLVFEGFLPKPVFLEGVSYLFSEVRGRGSGRLRPLGRGPAVLGLQYCGSTRIDAGLSRRRRSLAIIFGVENAQIVCFRLLCRLRDTVGSCLSVGDLVLFLEGPGAAQLRAHSRSE